MRLVLIEDDPNKSRYLVDLIQASLPEVALIVRRSYTSGLREIRSSLPDLILLDMSLPNFDPDIDEDSGKFRSYGGRDVMHQLVRRKLDIKVIIVTQFETFATDRETLSLADLSASLQAEFPRIYAGTVYYNPSQDDWKEKLISLIRTLEEAGHV